MRARCLVSTASMTLALLLAGSSASALDKQGSAHGGSAIAADDGFDVEGSLSLGMALINPSYAARPDNTGLTLMRYAGHADVDLIGRRLSLPVDVNVFTDRTRGGLEKLGPTELDTIAGVTSTWETGPGSALEIGVRGEHDRPVDTGRFTQSYGDVRVRWLYSLAAVAPKAADALGDGDVTGWLTLGLFALNHTYAARPDNSGLALLRYAAHVELSLWHDYVSFCLDGTMFTDRHVGGVHRIGPSELDLTPEIILHKAPFELHLAYERDLPIDRSGLVQSFVYALVGWSFDTRGHAPPTLENRTQIPSP